MGTRYLTAVRLDGEYKIAQYGQFDGYPSGAGVDVLEFVRKIQLKDKLDNFKTNVRCCRWITQSEIDEINAKIKCGEIKRLEREYPELSRDTGAEILDMVYKAKNGLALTNHLEFAFDHIFCEYIWCIDLDANVFGLYGGDDKAHTLKPVKTWIIGFAPPKEEFLSAFGEEEV